MKHIKPTKDELDANAQKALEEAEALKPSESTEETETSDKPSPSEEPKPTKDPEEEQPSPSPDIDYKKKFTESTREAQILHAKNKKINEAVDKAKELPEPTEDELRKEYADWDVLTDTEKKLAKENMIGSRRFAMLESVTAESKDIEAWNTKVDTFISDPKTITDHPDLEGKEDEFKIFAGKPTRRGVDFEDLIPAFLYNRGKAIKTMKGKMFETGSGGPNDKPKPKSDKLTMEQARQLRNTNYPKYKEYLIAGKIDQENI